MSEQTGTMINPRAVYLALTEDLDLEVALRAVLLLKLERRLAKNEIVLRWPEPPLDSRFDAQFEYEFKFQIEWMKELLELSCQLSKQEQARHPLPPQPYSEATITEYINGYKKWCSNLMIKCVALFQSH